jgi:actin-related protein 5
MRIRKEHKEQLGNRKSLAAQQRMQTITNMASEAPTTKKKRKKGTAEDTFGANDDDWAVYREIVRFSARHQVLLPTYRDSSIRD